MSTKAQVEAKITAIQDGGANTALEAREAWQIQANELYSTAVSDSQTTETYTTKTGTALNYSFTLKKSGNEVMVKGTITNNGFSVLSSQNVCTWKDTEFKPKSGLTYIFDAVQGSNKVKCFINNNVFAITSPMNSGVYTIDNFQTYIAQD